MIKTAAELQQSATNDPEPPAGLSPELKALWFTGAKRWEEAHDIAQDIPSSMGSWIHGHLHLIEGDLGNAGYWYSRAGQPATAPDGIDDEWIRLVEANL